MNTLRKLRRGLVISTLCSPLLLVASVGAAEPTTQKSAASVDSATVKSDTAKTAPSVSGNASDSDLTSLSLEELMQIQVDTTATITKTDRNLVPAAITTIDRAEIDQANPRSLNALLDVYVPNFESFPNQYEQTQIGARGINGDRDNKFLTLVNGQEINERSHGFIPELDLLLLGDLQEVDMVRGPGSATYGPGAIAGVISQQTYNGLTFQGTEVTGRVGFVDQFYSAEFKHGQKLSPDSGWFIYGGFAQLTGADQRYSPIIQGSTFDASYGHVQSGQPLPFPYARQDAEFNAAPQLKLHAEFDSGGLTMWTRYTRGGESNYPAADRGWYSPSPFGFNNGIPGPGGIGYDQLTGFVGYKTDLSKTVQLDVSTSIEVTNFQRVVFGFLNDNNQEIKWTSRAVLNWQMAPTNEVAVGTEYREYWMGLPTWDGLPDGLLAGSSTANGANSAYATPHRWESNLVSLFAEDQWHITPKWTLLLSGRADKDRYTHFLFSPRAALAYQPTPKDTLKMISSLSLRTNDEEDMRAQWENSQNFSTPERLTDYELRYERKQSDNLFLAASVYYNDLQAIDWGGTSETSLGSYQTAGAEIEAIYRTHDNTITLSHGYTKLVGEQLTSAEFTNITSGLYGFGYDLSNWSNNVTKLAVHHQFNQHLSADGNIEVLWDFEGDRQVRAFENSTAGAASWGPTKSNAFAASVFLNLGSEYKFDQHSTLRIDAYNVLGWADRTFNKLDGVNGNFREAAPAFGLSYKYTF